MNLDWWHSAPQSHSPAPIEDKQTLNTTAKVRKFNGLLYIFCFSLSLFILRLPFNVYDMTILFSMIFQGDEFILFHLTNKLNPNLNAGYLVLSLA